MKKIYAIAGLLIASAFTTKAQDLQISNIQYNYDFQTATLDVNFDLDNIGTFSCFNGVVCEVSIMDLGTSEYVAGSTTSDSFGLGDGDTENLTVSNMDLDNISGLATGNYYVKVCADVTNLEAEDNEGNNCSQNNNSFSFESLGNPASTETLNLNSLNALLYPNPVVSNTLTFSLNETLNETPEITITDATGKMILVKAVRANNNIIEVETNDLNQGIYFYTLSAGSLSQKGRFIRK